jgi:uncharacterized protein (DUF2147 family)
MRHNQQTPKSTFPKRLAGLCGGVAAAVAGLGAAPGDAPMPPEVGLWYNHSGKGAVEIRPCDNSTSRLCGNIVWLKDPNGKNGQALKDGRNTRSSLRGRPICGLPVLGSLRRMRGGGWDDGWVYDPEVGKTFDAAIKLASRDRLILTGYKGIKLFSKSFTWKRAPNDLPRCSTEPAEREASLPSQAEPPPLPFKKAAQIQVSRQPQGRLMPPSPVPAIRPTAP